MPHLRHLQAGLRQSFWLVPAICALVAVLLALGVPELDIRTELPFLFPGGAESARSSLSSITTAMISITALVFSLTIVALQLAAGQFSPRVMRDFLRDRLIQLTLGIFIATFTYTMVLQRSVKGTTGSSDESVPEVEISLAFALVLLSVGFFIAYIDHMANAIRVANIVDRIGINARETIETLYRPNESSTEADHAAGHRTGRELVAPRAGVVVSLNEDALVKAASRSGAVLIVSAHVGDYLPKGAPLLTIVGEIGQKDVSQGESCDDSQLLRHVAFDTERTYEQDVALGFRELVDIAERALSPGVNDPTTAAQAIDVLHDLLRQIAGLPAPTGWYGDSTGRARLFVPGYGFDDLLELSMAEILHYGYEDVQTPRRLRRMLDDLASMALPAHQPAISRWISAVQNSATQNSATQNGAIQNGTSRLR